MSSTFLTSVLEHYHWLWSLYTLLGIAAVSLAVNGFKALTPTFREANQVNGDAFKAKMAHPHYAANQKWNRKWAAIYLLIVFGIVMPFCVTLEAQPWWRIPLDIVAILFVYDFAYYLTHRFIFHDSKFFGGPLKWMHAVHHRQHNPCARDSTYIHPLEVAIGLGLFVATLFLLSRFVGPFHIATVVISWFAFTGINIQNHTLWKANHFPFGFLNYASRMHHNHHAKFTGGNFATITLLFDWMFGTLDNGDGYKRG